MMMVPICLWLWFIPSFPFLRRTHTTKAQLEYEIRWNTGCFLCPKKKDFSYMMLEENEITSTIHGHHWRLLEPTKVFMKTQFFLLQKHTEREKKLKASSSLLCLPALNKEWNNGSHISRSGNDSVDSQKSVTLVGSLLWDLEAQLEPEIVEMNRQFTQLELF